MIKTMKIGWITFVRSVPVIYDPAKTDDENMTRMQKICHAMASKPMTVDSASIQPFAFDKKDGWNPVNWLTDDYPSDDGFDFDPDKDILQ